MTAFRMYVDGQEVGTAEGSYGVNHVSFGEAADLRPFGTTRGTYEAECEMTFTDEGRTFFAELAALSRPALQVSWTEPRKVVHHATTRHLSGRARRLFRAIRRREAKLRRPQVRVFVLPPDTHVEWLVASRVGDEG